jgi:farnesyl diphosphate synthase
MLGAGCGKIQSDAEVARLDRYAKCAGLAFQVIDDVLDAQADTATLGKTAGKDAQHDKPTYVTVMGVTGARKFADELYEASIHALDGFDAHADQLRDLAAYIVKRPY